ncbi:MAG: hypothetical protein HC880_00760 [Bacteroidia bacterium]|nr:hypothetical protein [Bacteroidia bacterium]
MPFKKKEVKSTETIVRTDPMKPVAVAEQKHFSDTGKPQEVKTGFAAKLSKDENQGFGGKVPPYPRSVLIEKGLIKPNGK